MSGDLFSRRMVRLWFRAYHLEEKEPRNCRGAIYALFTSPIDASLLDREPFIVGHDITNHPALHLENLGRVVCDLPEEQVFYSSGRLSRGANFDRAHLDHATGLTLAQTIEEIRTTNSYVMVRAPESHPSLTPLFREMLDAVEALMKERGFSGPALDPMLYLFIASPGSVTPFHIDRYSTFLFQIQGTKDVYVFPAFDAHLVEPRVAEEFVVWAGGRPEYRSEFDVKGKKHVFAPGQALHIPFMAPHHVQNGPDEVSISVSIIFNTPETLSLLSALRFNHKLRRLYRPVGLAPTPVGHSPKLDRTKGRLQGWISGVRSRDRT